MNKIEEAKQVLRDAGFFVDNLWHVDDVHAKCSSKQELTDSEALDLLEEVITSEFIMVHINEGIEDELDYNEED